jgi:hypothetical protein
MIIGIEMCKDLGFINDVDITIKKNTDKEALTRLKEKLFKSHVQTSGNKYSFKINLIVEWNRRTLRSRHLSEPENKALDEFIHTVLQRKFIEETVTDKTCYVLLVKKPNGKNRTCVDYCSLNYASKANSYLITLIDKY